MTIACIFSEHYAAFSRAGSAGTRKSSKPKVILTEPCIINTNTPYFVSTSFYNLQHAYNKCAYGAQYQLKRTFFHKV